MGSETADPVGDSVKASTRSGPSKKNPGNIPRKIHKAAREKLKRDHMNDLFLNLSEALDLDNSNNGKASILRETTRLLGELLTQVDNLRKENVTLSSESNYVTIERNELLEETSALDAQIKKLQREIDERTNCSNVDISQPQSNSATELPDNHVPFPLVGHGSESTPGVPVLIMPLHHESHGFPSPFTEVNLPKAPPTVSRPRPRYPSSSDSWPPQIVTKPMDMVEDV
ncbi:hypothetical protein CDL12_02776 [Handroanthus impetiginosus]|uniref:BHLH domain-containing protein n=1 Tax=Handroanthus impetiginosus TaxID=429701 RepID=A0A2G9I402_9LAMI|nr:hypothetical protein CDL12_02776 [Handroanthus impetiginosus]